jgi:hypothetical protein
MRIPQLALAKVWRLSALLSLAACTGQPMPTTLSAADMATLLGGSLQASESGEAEVAITRGQALHLLALRQVVPLDDDEAALITRSQRATRDGEALTRDNGHAVGGGLDVHYLKWTGQQWQVTASHLASLSIGAFGEFGKVTVHEPRPGLKAVLVQGGGTWQGHTAEHLTMVLLDRQAPRSVLSLASASDNLGACAPEDTCWEAQSTVKLRATDDEGMAEIRVEQYLQEQPSPMASPAFKAMAPDAQAIVRQRMVETSPKRNVLATRGLLVYRWDGQAYRLRSGTNLVPPI